jgi:glycosyltransferase involved in cell wall biosynthesis
MNIEIQWAADLLTGYDYTFLPEAEGISETGFTQINNPSIIPALKNFAPDVVHVHGYAQLTTLRAILWCNFHKIPVLLSADSSLLFKRPQWKMVIKDLFLPQFMRFFYGVISTGDNNTAYYKYYRIKANRIFSCPFTIDELALSQAKNQKLQLRAQLRAQYGIAEGELVLLFVGKLAPWKRPQDFLNALAIAQKELGASVNLVAFFAGNGLLLEELQASATSQNLRAIFAGFINLDVLPKIYAMADVLVFPSQREAYGLSAREAIFLGLPLIVSDQVGCVGKKDAARPNINALVFPSMDVSSLADAIVFMASNPQKFASMAAASECIASELNHDKSVEGYLTAISSACQK